MCRSLAARVLCQWFLGVRWERRREGLGVCHLLLSLSVFSGAPHFLPQLRLASLSPELLWFHGSNLICVFERPTEILKLLITSHTSYLSKFRSETLGWDSLTFFKVLQVLPKCGQVGESLLQRVLLWSGPSPITNPTTSASAWFAHWACFPVQVCAASLLCLSGVIFPWVSAWLTSPFCQVPAPCPLPCRTLLQSSYHRSTCSFLPTRAEAPLGAGLGCVPMETSGRLGLSLAQSSCSLSISWTISLEKFPCWPWRESWLHACVGLGGSSGEPDGSF